MRSVLLALPAKESAHGYELKQALEHTFAGACPSPDIGQISVKQRRHCLNIMRGLSEPGHPEESDNPIASLLIEGAQLHLQADLEWLERCQEALT